MNEKNNKKRYEMPTKQKNTRPITLLGRRARVMYRRRDNFVMKRSDFMLTVLITVTSKDLIR